MKSYNKILFSGLIALVAGVFFVGCTSVDDTLGGNLIPGDMEMEIGSTVLGTTTIKTYIIGWDSIVSSKQGIYIIGAAESDVYGKTEASTVMQFWPTGTKLDVGATLTIDSALMYVSMVDYIGKADLEQEFGFYEILTPINRDSVYTVHYNQLETAGTYDTDPLFTIKLTRKSIGLVKLTYGAEGAAFLKKVIIDEEKAIYESNTSFLDKYQGFYLKKTTNTNEDGVFGLYAPYTEIDVYAHYTSVDTEGTSTVVNTVVPMTCSDVSTTGNISINKITHDYTTAVSPIQGINDTLPVATVRDLTYVQGLGGLSTLLRFDDSLLAEIQALTIDAQNRGFKYVSINKAEIEFAINEYDGPNKLDILNNSPTRLGMYSAFKSYSMIIDYTETSSDVGASFGGYLNRAKGTYTMNITNYLQLLLKKPTTTPRTITVAPSWGLSGLNFRDVELLGSGSAKPPKVKITYTLVK